MDLCETQNKQRLEKIDFGIRKCKGYCRKRDKNKACGELRWQCNNLRNCDKNYKKHYDFCYRLYEIKEIREQIDEFNYQISDIY